MNLGQPRNHSLFETGCNIFIGYWLGVFTQIILFSYLNINISFSQNMILTAIFSFISLIRGYILRRIFNWLHMNHLRKQGYM
jgi:hypothetical protein